MRSRIILVSAAAAIAAACIPNRNNRFDVVNAPLVEAYVGLVAHSGCPQVVSGDGAAVPQVGSALRTDCLAVVVHTQDPHGLTPVTYQVFSTGSAGTAALVSGTSQVAVIPSAWLKAQKPTGPISFSVIGTDRGGNTAAPVSASVVLQDLAPVAVVGKNRGLPLGGFRSAAGQDFSVPFDGSASFDLDDPSSTLHYHWAFSGIVTGTSNLAVPTLILPQGQRGRTVGVLTVTDPWGNTSDPQATAVDVGTAPLWLQPASGTLSRVDNAQELYESFRGSFRVATLDTSLYFAVTLGTTTLYAQDWPTDATPNSVPLTGFAAAIASDPREGVVYVITVASNVASFQAWPVSGKTIGTAQPAVVLPEAGTLFGGAAASTFDAAITLDSLGNAWYSGFPEAQVLGEIASPASSAPVVTDLPLASGRILTAVSPRPGLDSSGNAETWMMETRDFTSDTAGVGAPAEILRYSVGANGIPVALPSIPLAGTDIALGLGWTDPDHFWIYDFSTLRLVDASQLPDLELATVHQIPIAGASQITVDPLSGDAWVSQPGTALYVARTDGTFRTLGPTSAVLGGQFDREGALVFAFGGFAGRGFAAGNPTLGVVDIPSGSGAGLDPFTGGVWVLQNGGGEPHALIHLSSEAEIDGYYPSLSIDGSAPEDLPLLTGLLMSDDGRTGYAFEEAGIPAAASGLDAINFNAQPPTVRRILGASGLTPFQTSLLSDEPFGRVTSSGGAPSLWIWDNVTYQYLLVNTAGTAVGPNPVLQIPVAEQGTNQAHADRDLSNGDLCVGTFDNSNPTNMILRRVTQAGAATEIGTAPVGPINTTGFVSDVSAVADATRDVCWVSWYCEFAETACNNVGGYVAGYLPNGTLVHPLIQETQFVPFALFAESPDDVWSVEFETASSNTFFLFHYQWDASGNLTSSFTSIGDGSFLHP